MDVRELKEERNSLNLFPGKVKNPSSDEKGHEPFLIHLWGGRKITLITFYELLLP
jgi:hypothetical protein